MIDNHVRAIVILSSSLKEIFQVIDFYMKHKLQNDNILNGEHKSCFIYETF